MKTDGSISEHGKAYGGLARDDKGDSQAVKNKTILEVELFCIASEHVFK